MRLLSHSKTMKQQQQTTPTTADKATELSWLRHSAGDMSTLSLRRMADKLTWFSQMPASRRSTVALVAQAGIESFINWYADPTTTPWIASDVFGAAPRELVRSISLQETLQLTEIVVDVLEEHIAEQSSAMREAVLRFSREVAFSAAHVYARAAEARGLWDARLEALIVDSILNGSADEALPSRLSALGWRGRGKACVVIGQANQHSDLDEIRRIARKAGCDILISVQERRMVIVLGVIESSPNEKSAVETLFAEITQAISEQTMPDRPYVIGSAVESLSASHLSAKTALSGAVASSAIPNPGRPIHADELLPERSLAGDRTAKQTLYQRIYLPLLKSSPELLTTLSKYFETGRSLEQTARELRIHTNTVRYRLKKISEIVGWQPSEPRDAFVLQTAVIIGKIHSNNSDL